MAILEKTRTVDKEIICFHCGDDCILSTIAMEDKIFCCEGCKTVYGILHQHELDNYYCYANKPGNKAKPISSNKFAYLQDEDVQSKLITFKNQSQSKVNLYLPQMHCASCLWLLEHLYKIDDGFITSQVNFLEKQVSISFNHNILSLQKVAEILTQIGYEPHITLDDYDEKNIKKPSQAVFLKLGIVGFCFANIMLINFPEYLGLELLQNKLLVNFFRYVNLLLALPVLLFGAKEFYVNAWTGFKQKIINIDAPIALAISITFGRSVYEILSQTGAGYLDSMSGIIFFMLIGRSLQQKTFTTLKFTRDYKSYFPISVNVLVGDKEVSKKIQDVVVNDVVSLQHEEIIPVDGILSSRTAEIDYSFVTGENEISTAMAGNVVYAGGKVVGSRLDLIVIKPFTQNSFTALWNNDAFKKKEPYFKDNFVEKISNYFSVVLLLISFSAFIYWQLYNPSNAWNALTSVLIVACPCTLLLASSYTYGFIINAFASKGFFVKNAEVLIKMNKVNHIVFDKTGTLTDVQKPNVSFVSSDPTNDLALLLPVLKSSTHPICKSIVYYFNNPNVEVVTSVKEHIGQGIEAWYKEHHIKIGQANFVGVAEVKLKNASLTYYQIDGISSGYFIISTNLKTGVPELIASLKNNHLSLLSGDNDGTHEQMKNIFPSDAHLLFNQTPQMKLDYIKQKQSDGEVIMMIGDGLNDAGALKQSDIGISIVHDNFTFTPSSDVILNTSHVKDLKGFLSVSSKGQKLIVGLFIYSLLYNIIGLSIAVSASLKPMIAAILMPISSISVILISYIGTQILTHCQFGKDVQKADMI